MWRNVHVAPNECVMIEVSNLAELLPIVENLA
jgi:hypothetical protein